MIEAALELADHGLAVFPVARDGRTPLTKHGCHDSTKAVEGVRALWGRHPTANLSVACGAVSGVLVIDLDRHDGGGDGIATMRALVEEHGPLPRSWKSTTPRGGCHLWFSHVPGLRNRVGVLRGLDVRTDGGSVAAPPSVRRDGVYSWARAPWTCELQDAPVWLVALIAPPPPPARPVVRPLIVGSPDRMARYVARAIEEECATVAGMGPGGRNLALFQASARLGELVGAGLAPEAVVADALEAAAFECGLTQEDGRHAAMATIRSGLNRGIERPRVVAA